MSDFAEHVVQYIAGFVVLKLKQKINCVTCILNHDESTSINLITFKDRGGPTYPSNQVVVVSLCNVCEKVCKEVLSNHLGVSNLLNIFRQNVFDNIDPYIFMNFNHDDNVIAEHSLYLLRIIMD